MARRSTAELKEDDVPPPQPRLTEHLVAHTAIEKQLLELVAADRLPHALLFTGPRGVGKATLAWRLARFLLTPQEKGGSLFGDPLPPESLYVPAIHPIFKRMAAGAHPDFMVLEADTIKVEEARAVVAFLALTPAEGEWRVVIIDSADSMNRSAANALLKTLEEPPSRAVLLLISHNPGTLLSTVRSRCRTVRVAPLTEAEFARVLGLNAPELTAQQAQVMALLSGCSPGMALTLIEARADILYKELLERVTTPDTAKSHAFADRFARRDAEANWHMLEHLFLWMLFRIASGAHEPEVFAGEQAALAQLREGKSLAGWLDLWERTGKLFADTDHLYLDKKQVVISLLKAASEPGGI